MLRYHGGKWKIAPWIIKHFPPHRIYVEPYGGAAGVLLRKGRSYLEVYNDLDEAVVNVFRVLRDPDQAQELERLLRLTPFAREEFELSAELAEDPVEWARRTVARAFMGFGTTGGYKDNTGFRAQCYRTHKSGAADWRGYPDELRYFSARLQGVVIENRPALEVIAHQDTPGTLFYVDPPYPQGTRNDHGGKYRYEMSDEEHAELAQVLHGIGGMALVSGYACELYGELYGDWACVTRETVASGNRGGTARVEHLWISPTAERARRPLLAGLLG